MEDKPETPLPEPSGEANPKSAESSVEITPTTPPQPQTEECNLSKPSLSKLTKLYAWWKVWWPRAKTAWLLFGEMVMLLWAVALWDSYRPKITVSPGGTMNSKSPFGTFFIVQNQGALSIYNITYRTQLKYAPMPGTTNQIQSSTIEQNITVIPQMKSLECYAFPIHYAQVQINTYSNQVSQTLATNQLPISGLLLSFDVSYKAQFFPGKRTDTLFFIGVPDVDGNWQWLPTAHQSMMDQIIDTNLIPKSVTNPAPATIPTNGSTQVHTNQAKPN